MSNFIFTASWVNRLTQLGRTDIDCIITRSCDGESTEYRISKSYATELVNETFLQEQASVEMQRLTEEWEAEQAALEEANDGQSD